MTLRLPRLPTSGRAATRRRLRLAVARHRRLLVAGLLAAAVASAAHALSPPSPTSTTVWVASRDLGAGSTLAGRDLVAAPWPPEAVPDGALDAASAAGRVLAAPLRRGEPVTDARVVGSTLLAGQPPGVVALPLTLADAASAALLRPGDVVDVLAGGDPAGLGFDGGAEVVVRAARVLAVPASGTGASDDPGGGPFATSWAGDGAALVVVATDDAAALAVAGAADRPLSVAIRSH